MKRRRPDDGPDPDEPPTKRVRRILSSAANATVVLVRLRKVFSEAERGMASPQDPTSGSPPNHPPASIFRLFTDVLFPSNFDVGETAEIEAPAMHCVRCHQDFDPSVRSVCCVPHSYVDHEGSLDGEKIRFQFPCCLRKYEGDWREELGIVVVNGVETGSSRFYEAERLRARLGAAGFAEKVIPWCFHGAHTTNRSKVKYNERTIKERCPHCQVIS